jgi:hypothetical protein
LLHLLKLKFQPGEVYRHNSWQSSIEEAPEQIADIVKDSPGIFQGRREVVVAKVNKRARRAAVRQSQLPLSTFPEVCPWAYERIVDEEFFPRVTKS